MAKEAEKKTVEKKKYVATVMEITHGRFFNKHKHYIVKVIEVEASFNSRLIIEAAIESTSVANGIFSGNSVRVLTTKEVEITPIAEIRARGKSFRAFKESIKK